MVEPVALGALACDAALGWPAWLHARTGHPVGAFARLISCCDRRWNRPDRPDEKRRQAGVATLLLLIAMAGGGGLLAEILIRKLAGDSAWVWLALAAWPGLAQRSLYQHASPVVKALEADDLPAAREAVGRIVGRDTASLDRAGVARAATESLAESFCDGVVAPLFWLLVLGLPGLWTYKAVNTADSLIGHREQPYTHFGWASARFDDLLNFVPARLSAALLCIAGGGGWTIMRRDHGNHASPNSGWPEAAMAGALGIRLAGPVSYDGVQHVKPWIGEGPAPDAAAARAALALYVRACGLLWIAAITVEVLR